MIQANLKGDTDFYQKYYAENAIIVHGNGKLFTKAQELADLKSGSLKYESIDVREKTIHAYGATAVIHIEGTVTRTGLRVKAILKRGGNELGERVSNEEMRALRIEPHTVCPAWNYTISPRPRKPEQMNQFIYC